MAELVAELLPQAIGRLPWPKSMRWGGGDFRWVRPLQSMLCLLDGTVVPFELAGVASGDRTRGHRFLAPEPFAVRDFADYVVKLRHARVILDGAERRAIIARRAAELAAAEGLALADDPALLDELKGLVEWPVPLAGRHRRSSSWRCRPRRWSRRCAPTRNIWPCALRKASWRRRFVLVANMEASDGGAAIVAGNERVLRARLWDAKFFWDQDRKVALESRLPALDRVVFHAELGTQGQRVQRLVALTGALAPLRSRRRSGARPSARRCWPRPISSPAWSASSRSCRASWAATTPRRRARPPRWPTRSASTTRPRAPTTSARGAPTSVAVALADRLDTLVGFFAAGIRPTGSRDPFALRRAGLGIIRLIFENGLRLPLRPVVRGSSRGLRPAVRKR